MYQSHIAVIGLKAMGANLARNLTNKGHRVSVYNRTYEVTQELEKKYGTGALVGYKTLQELIESIEKPKKILLLVKAGEPTDGVIDELIPLLEKGDIIIDGGNSFFKDTIRRTRAIEKQGIHFVGSGISGGAEGALKGPSIMPGGSPYAWDMLKPIFESIAAKDFSGGPCVTHIGTDGAGHFVKMVHNGIEYGVMQMIAEVYDILSTLYGLRASEIATIFEEYNSGALSSFLIEITVPVLKKTDEESDKALVDVILDTAGQKGTGRWTIIEALELGTAIPTITAATLARTVSSYNAQRVAMAKKFPHPKVQLPSLQDAKKMIEHTLYAGMLTSYAEGYEMMRAGAKEYGWHLNLSEITRIWEGGCIIRSKALNILREALAQQTSDHLFTLEALKPVFENTFDDWKQIVTIASQYAIPIPSLTAAFYYYISMHRGRLPANLIQGLRDYFGSHTYQRVDKEGIFHTEWNEEVS